VHEGWANEFHLRQHAPKDVSGPARLTFWERAVRKRTWVWPLNWHYRIRQLEAEVSALKVINRDLNDKLLKQAIGESMLSAAYLSAVTAMASSATDHIRARSNTSDKP
jgi:hypothetical protein